MFYYYINNKKLLKILKRRNKMAKKPFSLEFDMQPKGFKFKKEFCLRGAVVLPTPLKKVQFKYYLDKNTHSSLLNSQERKIDFHFTLQMFPDFGEINFDGECILESPEQNKIQFCLFNKIPPFIQFIDGIILKKCYENSKKIAEKNNIPFPPVNFLMKLSVKK